MLFLDLVDLSLQSFYLFLEFFDLFVLFDLDLLGGIAFIQLIEQIPNLSTSLVIERYVGTLMITRDINVNFLLEQMLPGQKSLIV